MHNMLIRPTPEELEPTSASPTTSSQRRAASRPTAHRRHDLDQRRPQLRAREFVILGTEYAGEMKKGVFTIMNYLMPKQGVLSMHCSANEGDGRRLAVLRPVGHRQDDAVRRPAPPAHRRRRALLERRRRLQHRGRLLREGINLSPRSRSPRSGTRSSSARCSRTWSTTSRRASSTTPTSITENTRCSYPIEYIPNAKIPCVGGHPKNVIFLTCDAFGVLPPVSQAHPGAGDVPLHQRLHRQGRRHRGRREGPRGDVLGVLRRPFMVWHPTKYAELLAQDQASTAPGLAGQHRLERRRLRRGASA
jgi:phosphoenolpyruvate carboxykinase (ATP)